MVRRDGQIAKSRRYGTGVRAQVHPESGPEQVPLRSGVVLFDGARFENRRKTAAV